MVLTGVAASGARAYSRRKRLTTGPPLQMADISTLHVAVLIERRQQPNAWEDWRFTITDVAPDDAGTLGEPGAAPRLLRDDGRRTLWLHAGLVVTLHADEAEGYHLNLSSGAPVWFVMWRTDDNDPARAWPERVTLSYNEAARLLDAQERVDTVALTGPVRDWLQAYTDRHYRPEPRQRRRPASFQAPARR